MSVQWRSCGILQALAVAAVMMYSGVARAQDAPDTQSPASMHPAPIERKTTAVDAAQEPETPPQPQFVMPPPAPYDKAIFMRTIASADLQFLKQFDGAP